RIQYRAIPARTPRHRSLRPIRSSGISTPPALDLDSPTRLLSPHARMVDLQPTGNPMIINRHKIFSALYWIILTAVWMLLAFTYFQQIIAPGTETIAFSIADRSIEIMAPRWFGLALFLPVLWLIARFTLSD